MKKYLVCTAIGIIVFAVCFIPRMSYEVYEEEAAYLLRIISDSCFSVGVFLFGVGSCLYIFRLGFFDMIMYSLTGFFKHYEEDYCEYKRRGSKKTINPAPMVTVGAGFILASVIFCFFYYL